MPREKKKTTKAKEQISENAAQVRDVEIVEPGSALQPSPAEGRIETILSQADLVVKTKGTVSTQRAQHDSKWAQLMVKDMDLRSQILTLKAKENEVLSMIRDRVGDNLMETIDTGVKAGLLKEPTEA